MSISQTGKITWTPITPLLSRTNRPSGAWYNKEPQCNGKTGAKGGIPRRVCDEYPYATSAQGWKANYDLNKVSIHPVLETEQSITFPRSQGRKIDEFYRKAIVVSSPSSSINPFSWYINFAVPWGQSFWLERGGVKRDFQS
jgi:hypothetical protein